ncbi:MAG: undecaprenyl-diphosphatase UppP [Acidobacteriota bacterium]|nr:undecaprenyl-diphosphatase UppP [Blastocatellia bacterium]MDW8411699.1 undecaprenyl-diphosphatase UppP [Acidobacteriota bacterium]
MDVIKAIILGITQGLTEFIPISSTAHLTLVGRLLGVVDSRHPEQWTAFMAVMQLGTLVAVLTYFASDIITIGQEFLKGNIAYLQQREGLSPAARLGWYVAIGSLPIGILGLLFKDFIEGAFTKNLYVISGSLIGLALLLFLAECLGKRNRTVNDLGVYDALVIGIAQALALIPGSSRSGTTITAGLFLGMTRVTAARFSFLLSIPAIGASGLYEFYNVVYDNYRYGGLLLDRSMLVAVVASTFVSAVVGYISIAFLMTFLQQRSTAIFIIYRILLGLLLMVLLVSGKLEP